MNDRQQMEIREGWERIAEAYQHRYAIPCDKVRYGPMCPSDEELQLLGAVDGRRVLDIGCGGGQNSIALARRGARVTAIDPCETQLRFAKALAVCHGVEVEFLQASAEETRGLGERFDIVLSCYALMFVADVAAVFRQVRHLLRVGGIFVVSVDHPMRLSGDWNEADEFVVRNYFQTGWQSWHYDFPERATGTTMHRYHRTLGQWVQAIVGAGLRLTRLMEPLPAAEADEYGRISRHGVDSPKNVFHRGKLARVPGTLVLTGASE
jgi:2-polyprenyl-3-methyl-5-hydroxy-6-metoxy-1,4-benzoquinol methylase